MTRPRPPKGCRAIENKMFRPTHYIYLNKMILLRHKLSYTNCLCMNFIDHSRTGLTASSDDDCINALRPKEWRHQFNLLHIYKRLGEFITICA
jgi:hypothetical protein